MKEFYINQFITLRLENGKTEIYVNGEHFIQCKFLLVNIPIMEMTSFDDIESIDEITEGLNHSLESRPWEPHVSIDPETEFWGHCSNLQVWAENNYNTRLIHRNIAFPLLKKLTEVRDIKAKKVFKEEIAKRFTIGTISLKNYLIEQGFLEYLNREEFWSILPEETKILHEIEKKIEINFKIFPQDEEYLYVPTLKNQIGFIIKKEMIKTIVFYNCSQIKDETWNWIFKKLSEIKSLKILGIEYCDLNTIPIHIKNIKYLEMLLLGGNNLKDIPEFVKDLKKLKSIEIDNKLKDKKIIEELKEKDVKIHLILPK